MKRFVLTMSLLASLSGSALAQDPGKRDFLPPPPAAPVVEDNDRQDPSPSDLPSVSMNPEIWLYLQELKRYDDPKQAVRRKAEQRTADRQARIAAMKWYGYSNSRPTVSASPWISTYSPFWAGNSWDPYRHVGIGWPSTAVRYDQIEIRR